MRSVKLSTSLAFTASVGGFIYFVDYLRRNERKMLTFVLDKSSVKPNLPSQQVRSEFRDCLLPSINIDNPVHSHPSSAAWRSSTLRLARQLADRLGLSVFVEQASNSDVKAGIEYSRHHYWAKDLATPASFSKPTSRSLVVFVDVDYYVDMNAYLLQNRSPVLLYTLNPTKVSESIGEFAFNFNANNEIQYMVSGGASYKHKLWDYNHDVLTVKSLFKTVTYLVERRKANEHHEYVLLVPFSEWSFPMNIFSRFLSHDYLDRLSVNAGDFNVLKVKSENGILMSISRVGEFNEATIDCKTFDAINAVDRHSKLDTGHATVNSWVDDRHISSVVMDYIRTKNVKLDVCVVYPATSGVRGYQILDRRSELDFDAKPLLAAYMSPIVPNCFVPLLTLSNERAAVVGRIIKPGLESKAMILTAPSNLVLQYIDEFVDLMVGKQHKLHPYEVEDVYDHMTRRNQRALLEQFDSADVGINVAKTFMKAEPYQKVNDPRIITTYNNVVLRKYSTFLYSATEWVVANCPWYTFGKTPIEIANSVVKICRDRRGVNCSDCSRMDGHVSEFARILEARIMLRLFGPEHHSELIELMKAQYNIPGRTTLGVKYDIEYHRGSGSPDTALFNTFIGKFCDFTARRLGHVDKYEAYTAPGEFGGDDAITSCYPAPGLIEKAGAMIGQSIENVFIERGAYKVNYLSRFYSSQVWYGNPMSTCDLPRALGKLHVAGRLGTVTPLEKLAQKLMGLSMTDHSTPIIGEIVATARRVGLLTGVKLTKEHTLVSWWSMYDIKDNWPNRLASDPYFIVHELFNTDIDVRPLFRYLRECKVPSDLLTMPALALVEQFPPNNKLPCVVDDTIRNVEEKKEEKPDESKCSLGKCGKNHKLCRDYAAGKCLRKKCKFPHIKRPYKEDLCKEGIEPHPGPQTYDGDETMGLLDDIPMWADEPDISSSILLNINNTPCPSYIPQFNQPPVEIIYHMSDEKSKLNDGYIEIAKIIPDRTRINKHCGDSHPAHGEGLSTDPRREYSPNVQIYLGNLLLCKGKARVIRHVFASVLSKFPTIKLKDYQFCHDGDKACFHCSEREQDNDDIITVILRPRLLGGNPKINGMNHESKKEKKEVNALIKRNFKGNSNIKSDIMNQQNVAAAYAASLGDPWHVAPISLGFGIYGTGVGKAMMYLRIPILTTTANFICALNPNACCNTRSATALAASFLNAFLSYCHPASQTATIAATTFTSAPAANCTVMGSSATWVRTVSAGLSVSVGQNDTAAQGEIFAARLPFINGVTSLDNLTTSILTSFPGCYTEMLNTSGKAEVTWAPTDDSDFMYALTSTTMAANPIGMTQALVAGVFNVPVGTSIYVDAVVNIEYGVGANSGGLTAASGIVGPFNPQGHTITQTFASPDELMSHAQQEGVPNLPRISPTETGSNTTWYQDAFNGAKDIWNAGSDAYGWLSDNADTIGEIAGFFEDFL